MSKHRTSQIELSLDSLLDTLFNVVGMLVIILLAVQLSAGETIREFTKNRQTVNLEELDAVRVKAEKLEKKLDFKLKLLKQLLAMAENKQKQESRIQQLKQRILRILQDVASLRRQAEYIRKRNYDNIAKSSEKDELIKEIDKIEYQIREQENILATLMAKNSKTDIELRVPVVRTASKSMESKFFFCKWGKLYYVDLDHLQKIMKQGLSETNININKFKAWMNNYDRGDEYLRLTVDYKLRYMIAPRYNGGWSIDEIKNPDSEYTQIIRQLDKNKYIVRFKVFADSYLIYLEARRIVEEYRLKAGWTAYAKNKEYKFYLGEKTRSKFD